MLVAENISKTHKDKNIIKNVTFSVNPGEVVGLLGPNGAGKSTSFNILAGTVKPDSGNIFFNGNKITNLSLSDRALMGISYLPQEMSIFRSMTVSENILTALEITEPNLHERKKKLETLLTDFSIEHLRYSQAITLSGGERRKLEIARCLATNPSYLLLDEPFSGIDPISIDILTELILNLQKKGIGILITEHNVKEALKIVDRAYILYSGEIIACDSKKNIINNKQVKRVYLGENF